MAAPPFDACAFAVERYKSIARWRNLWTILIFIFGTTVIVFLCAAIVLFINQSWLPGAVSTLGTIVNGVGIKWVVARRSEAVKEEDEAYNDVKSACPGAAPGHPTAEATRPGPDTQQQLEEFRKKLMLFGLFR